MTGEMDEGVIREKLKPYREELLAWVYGRIVAECRDRGVVPIAGFIPHATHDPERDRREAARQLEIAREAGFVAIDITDVYNSISDMKEVWLAEWDHHPNVEGHRLIADRLYDGLAEHLNLESAGSGPGSGQTKD